MKLLLTGDLHLGLTSTRLPSAKREMGRTISGWERLVASAVREKVNAVVLSGDLLDSPDMFWEASGPFQSGIQTLAEKGIRTLAVAGNHDADILPGLAKTLPQEAFTLMGANGIWERITLDENGSPALHLDAWSFPTPRFRQDPTLTYPDTPSGTVPVLGVVHGDLGAASSPYAPLSLSRLQSLPVDGWLLGHIHKPSLTGGTPWVLMPGSPHPLDPGEPDAHHAWMVETGDGTLSNPVPCCPAALEYHSVEISLTPEDIPSVDGIQQRIEHAITSSESDAYLVLRIRFTGQSDAIGDLTDITRSLTDWENYRACIEQVKIEVQPAIDLDALQDAGPVPANLAGALRDLPPECLTRLEQVLRSLTHQKEFNGQGLKEITLDDLPIRSLLERTLRATLEASE